MIEGVDRSDWLSIQSNGGLFEDGCCESSDLLKQEIFLLIQ
jgi:hypothetical protein